MTNSQYAFVTLIPPKRGQRRENVMSSTRKEGKKVLTCSKTTNKKGVGWGGSIRICHAKSSVFNTFLSRSSNPNLSRLSCWCLKKVTQFAENKIVRHFFCISGVDFSVTKSQESGQVFWLSQREGSETVRKWKARCKDEILCAVRTKYFALGA